MKYKYKSYAIYYVLAIYFYAIVGFLLSKKYDNYMLIIKVLLVAPIIGLLIHIVSRYFRDIFITDKYITIGKSQIVFKSIERVYAKKILIYSGPVTTLFKDTQVKESSFLICSKKGDYQRRTLFFPGRYDKKEKLVEEFTSMLDSMGLSIEEKDF